MARVDTWCPTCRIRCTGHPPVCRSCGWHDGTQDPKQPTGPAFDPLSLPNRYAADIDRIMAQNPSWRRESAQETRLQYGARMAGVMRKLLGESRVRRRTA